MTAKKAEAKNILVRVPVPLLKRLDAAAKRQQRSRAAEVRVRLEDSLRKQEVAV
jgi:predicted DNA-binding protein